MAVIFDSLKKTLDDIALFVLLRIKVMLNPEIGFIGDTSKGSMLDDENANLLATVCFIRENFFTLECNAFKKLALKTIRGLSDGRPTFGFSSNKNFILFH